MRGRYRFDAAQNQRRLTVVGELRRILAEVSVDCLEPDLVILDEFQRFKHLLDRPDEDAEREVSQLAHDLFTYERRQGAAAVSDALQDVHACRRTRD